MARTAKYSDEELLKSIKESESWSGVCRSLKLRVAGGTIANLKKKALLLDFDFSHFKGKAWQKGLNRYCNEGVAKQASKLEKKWEDVFRNGYYCDKAQSLLKRLVRAGKRELRCEICGIYEWRDKPMVFELHHLNRNRSDNREENLQILCPICHAQEHIAESTALFYEVCRVK